MIKFDPADDYTACHERRPFTMDEATARELVLLRTKLEVRTFVMRIAIGLFTGSWAGFLIALATGKIVIKP